MKYLVLLMLIATAASSQEIIERNATEVKRYAARTLPYYFFKVRSDGKYLAYATSTGNRLIDLDTDTEIKIPGRYDPVFINGTNLLVVPNREYKMDIFKLDQLLRNREQTKPHTTLKTIYGVYQSAAILKKGLRSLTIRVITDKNGKHMGDYKYRTRRGGKLYSTPLKSSKFCHNINQYIKLPMLSKDGKFLGGLNINSKTTVIYKINKDGSCTEHLDLGVKTGKVNFDYTGTKLTYHIYGPQGAQGSSEDDYINVPNSRYVSDIYTFDMNTKKIKRLTLNRQSNAMYPDFIESGDIVFTSYPHDRSQNADFVFIKAIQ